jgi:Domain of unknown function (DUF4350)
MRTRVLEIVVLLALLGVLLLLGASSLGSAPSNHSSYDTGRNGYRALFDVLAREAIPVTRLEAPLGQLDPRVRVLALTAPGYDSSDVHRLQLFLRNGGTVLAFVKVPGLSASPRLRTFKSENFSNLALRNNPKRVLAVYDAVAGKGLVAFDERPYGYDRTQSLWSVLPPPVHVAFFLSILAVVLALVDANVRFAPAIPRDPPSDRDSSAYLRSMASLLRRASAGRSAIERFARAYPKSADLAQLAALPRPSDALVLRAATIYAALRKEHA